MPLHIRPSPLFWISTLELDQPLTFRRGSELFPQESHPPVGLLIESGIARLSSSDSDGAEIPLLVGGPGTFITSDLAERSGLRLSCIAVTGCVVHCVSKEQFLKRVEDGGRISVATFAQLEAFNSQILCELVELRTLTVRARMEKLVRCLNDGSLGPAAKLKKSDIANILGVSRSYLSRLTNGTGRAKAAGI